MWEVFNPGTGVVWATCQTEDEAIRRAKTLTVARAICWDMGLCLRDREAFIVREKQEE